MVKKVTQGERSVFDVDLGILDVASGSPIVRPFDLTGIVLADSKICWRTGSSKITKAFDDPDVAVIGDDDDGIVQAVLDTTETGSLVADTVGDLEVVVDKGSGDVTKFQIIAGYQVLAKICD